MNRLADEAVISIEEVSDFGFVIVKANFSDVKIRGLLHAVTGLDAPVTGKINTSKKMSVAWMSTDEYAIILKSSDVAKFTKKIKTKMKSNNHLCLDMSDSRRCFKLFGNGWREVLSKGTPVDLNPKEFIVGGFRRTRIANLAVAIWSVSDNEAYVLSMYSVGGFIFEWLKNANLKSGQLNYY